MPRYMIQVTHGDDLEGCVTALRSIQQFGSHLMTHADWGCKDGVHACWLIADLENRDQAQLMVPPELRRDSHIIELNRFSSEEIAALAAQLKH